LKKMGKKNFKNNPPNYCPNPEKPPPSGFKQK